MQVSGTLSFKRKGLPFTLQKGALTAKDLLENLFACIDLFFLNTPWKQQSRKLLSGCMFYVLQEILASNVARRPSCDSPVRSLLSIPWILQLNLGYMFICICMYSCFSNGLLSRLNLESQGHKLYPFQKNECILNKTILFWWYAPNSLILVCFAFHVVADMGITLAPFYFDMLNLAHKAFK